MNLGQLRSATRVRLGVPATDGFFTDAVCSDLVNAAVQYLAGEEDWFWLETAETITTANGTDAYATAAASQRTIVLHDATGNPLERRGLDELVNIGTATGPNPRFFGYRGASIVLRPVPSTIAALTHVYVGTETRLVSDTDTPLMPSQYHDAIADYAAFLGHSRQGDGAQAKVFLEAAQRWVEQMKARSNRWAASTGGGAEVQS